MAASARLGRRGFQAWKFSPEKFTRSGTVDFLANLYGRTKEFSRGSVSGPGNGQLLGCFLELPRSFACTLRAFQKILMQWIGCAGCISMSRIIIQCGAMTKNNGT